MTAQENTIAFTFLTLTECYEVEKMWKEVSVFYFKVLYVHLSGRTREKYEEALGCDEILTFQIQNNFNHNITVYENINICLARF
jgi:hypothetical protein